MGSVSEALGGTYTVAFEGAKYRLRSPQEQGVKELVESWCRQRAVDATEAICERLPPAKARPYRRDLQADIDSGHYDYGADGCRRMLESPHGTLFYFRTLLSIPDDVPDLKVAELASANAAKIAGYIAAMHPEARQKLAEAGALEDEGGDPAGEPSGPA